MLDSASLSQSWRWENWQLHPGCYWIVRRLTTGSPRVEGGAGNHLCVVKACTKYLGNERRHIYRTNSFRIILTAQETSPLLPWAQQASSGNVPGTPAEYNYPCVWRGLLRGPSVGLLAPASRIRSGLVGNLPTTTAIATSHWLVECHWFEYTGIA